MVKADFREYFRTEAKAVITQAKRNLANNPHDKRGYRRINATGRLRDSLKARVYRKTLAFYMQDYGETVDAGLTGQSGKIQSNWNKSLFPRGRITTAPPTTRMWQWMGQKGIQNKGGGMAYNIAQKIRREGLQPKLFFSDAWQNREKKFINGLNEFWDKTITESLKEE